jgi:methylated-DNA-[protein]-cysteine S-methyltransferase
MSQVRTQDRALESWLDGAPQAADAVRSAMDRVHGVSPSDEEILRARARVKASLDVEPPAFYFVARLGRSPVGPLCLAMTERGLARLEFCEREEDFLTRLRQERRVEILREPERARPVLAQLADYLAGQRQFFDLKVDLRGRTEFQRQVLEGASRIPRGRVTTYGELARRIGRPGAARAVGQALGGNPVPIVIPCHRVLGGDGSLHGYSGGAGTRTKEWLLRLEEARLSSYAEPY